MELEIKITGAEELEANLRSLAVDMQGKMVVKALQAGGAVVRDVAQAEAPVNTGALATSMTMSTRGGAVLVGPNKERRNDAGDKRHMRNESIGIFQERGTVAYFGLMGRIKAADARRKRKNVIYVERTEERTPATKFLEKALAQAAPEAFQAEVDKLHELVEARFAKG